MLRSRSFDLFELDPDIEKSFQRRRREQRELRRQQLIEMTHQGSNLEHNAQPKNVPRGGIPPGFGNQAGRVQEPIVNEEDMLFGNFMNPSVVENESSIVYPPY
ncbi:Hypothetical predicted protein [Olea europaea subsp. europaea]|uniref:Uncharacterized protein n=1 Tax=Olea europaea subsp. europaea TaxID=158383 RepID=A0A8S0V4J7_OLEEU|nr:Hypothetical predicted protein [Olea europaea subsp. europaea]